MPINPGSAIMRVNWIVLVLVLSGLAVSAGSAGDDLKAMQGRWSATIAETNGKPASDELRNLKLVLVVESDTFRILANDKVISAGKLKFDPSKSPRTLDAINTEGPLKGVVQKAIYRIKCDSMTAVFAKPGTARPTEFKTKDGSEQSLIRYERMKK
jgi:uncharacterized protein (TIGR03067 family)